MKQNSAERQIKLRAKGRIDRTLMRSGAWHDGGGIVQFPDGSCMWVSQNPRATKETEVGSAPDLETARKMRAESWHQYLRETS